ncbi:PaaI family thioesterase [uncultured Jatrophihabitans sp.]|uniref:PaaI family thioesterase n=1 Tax=uncultured Jatrophihabitans sp. TaxID=1610747 RepID=UPI0035CBF00A
MDVVTLQNSGLNEALGFRFDVLRADRVEMSWTVGPQHLQPHGIVHGGVYCAAVEASASAGAAAWFGERGQVVGVANSTDFLRATREGRLVATATPVHQGRSQQLWVVEIVRPDGKLAARGQVRVHNLPGKDWLGPQ